MEAICWVWIAQKLLRGEQWPFILCQEDNSIHVVNLENPFTLLMLHIFVAGELPLHSSTSTAWEEGIPWLAEAINWPIWSWLYWEKTSRFGGNIYITTQHLFTVNRALARWSVMYYGTICGLNLYLIKLDNFYFFSEKIEALTRGLTVSKCGPRDWPCITIILSEFNNSILLEFLTANWIAHYFIKRKNFPRLFKTGKLFILVGYFTFYMLNWPEHMEITAYVCFTFRKMVGRNPYMLQSFKARLDKKKRWDIQYNRTQYEKSTDAENQNK